MTGRYMFVWKINEFSLTYVWFQVYELIHKLSLSICHCVILIVETKYVDLRYIYCCKIRCKWDIFWGSLWVAHLIRLYDALFSFLLWIGLNRSRQISLEWKICPILWLAKEDRIEMDNFPRKAGSLNNKAMVGHPTILVCNEKFPDKEDLRYAKCRCIDKWPCAYFKKIF